MIDLTLRGIAVALHGEVAGGQVLAPGPDHSPRDRSMTVRLSPSAPDGFLAFSHAGDDWRACRDHVRERLGLSRERGAALKSASAKTIPAQNTFHASDKSAVALALWQEGVDPRGTLGDVYLASRGLALEPGISRALRWHAGAGAMLALFRNINTGEPQAVSRTFLDLEGRKLERKFLGPVGGAAIALDPSAAVTHGLHIGEGVETCLAARQLGLRPTWALGSAGAIAAFPVLAGVECLSILVELDAGASDRATAACAERWASAGREVIIVSPTTGKDLNDGVRACA